MLVVVGVSWDLNWFLQLLVSVIVVAVGVHIFVKTTASKYFEVDANFEGDQHPLPDAMPGILAAGDTLCAVCATRATKKCSRCKAVRYCSQECQQSHWKSGHKTTCKDFSAQNGATTNRGLKASVAGSKSSTSIALIPASGATPSRPIKQPKDVLFPYDEFVNFFNWNKPGFPPCGLLNCGNSCFANVVLQCLSFTRPLVAYLLEKGHHRECCCNDWCFLCDFENHVERTRLSSQAFSPMNILSRLPNIGGTLGYGRQEDAHEFMRFSIDTMQSVCLDEFGGEKAVPPNFQETTLIQHIFGGRLQSEVICTKCDKISNQYENMMDLTVEIHGDAASLEECLDQFTARERLDGENMYKCEGCKDYVKAWKRLTIKCAPNILTIALKRFQSGRFGKLNKRIAFPETLNLSPYMSEAGDGSDIYKLYAVVVHIDMLNASFFGHYICYIKDFQGNWYRIDDWKVTSVELEDVLSQGAYMLLYSRCSARPSGLHIQTNESSGIAEVRTMEVKVEPGQTEQDECLSNMKTLSCSRGCGVFPPDNSPEPNLSYDHESSTGLNSKTKRERFEDIDVIDVDSTGTADEISCIAVESSYVPISQASKDLGDVDVSRSLEETSGCMEEQNDTNMAKSGPCLGLLNDSSFFDNPSSVSRNHQRNVEDDSEHTDVVKGKLIAAKDNAYYGNGFVSENKFAIPVEDASTHFSGIGSFPNENDKGNGIKKVENIS
ncbi:ubiquitin carboxyl-terminal hydrolase 18-like [Abrus precatorius]|uniref:ubiquitinyl hydrolase 1 n=1 Tax=Abrus precatorius TaxID=3816 RepID=A0A8B8JF20_ABRPR|nr:ubiquitin carboxyl-terminal hydrolase 18-like [Abrus precatorius]XP_027329819.1 ubiquitin carboxyl-terminal hydrolase 18-like [Abrus precatorius]